MEIELGKYVLLAVLLCPFHEERLFGTATLTFLTDVLLWIVER
ncbi:hypothetical protein [Paenibacillus xylanexedens]|nr:hypothetical protein [Paenibacillus xylanexedens]